VVIKPCTRLSLFERRRSTVELIWMEVGTSTRQLLAADCHSFDLSSRESWATSACNRRRSCSAAVSNCLGRLALTANEIADRDWRGVIWLGTIGCYIARQSMLSVFRRLTAGTTAESNSTHWRANDVNLIYNQAKSITACAVATICCISHKPFHWETGNFDKIQDGGGRHF